LEASKEGSKKGVQEDPQNKNPRGLEEYLKCKICILDRFFMGVKPCSVSSEFKHLPEAAVRDLVGAHDKASDEIPASFDCEKSMPDILNRSGKLRF
jgi:hypothetical protein